MSSYIKFKERGIVVSEKDCDCDCDCGIYYGYFWKDGIERKGMYCKECHQLLDYIPQY